MMMILLKRLLKAWGVVQPAERVAVNHEVAGSSPAAPAKTHKGEKMSTKENTQLRADVDRLKGRVSELVDDLAVIRRGIEQFKTQVASDIKYLTDNQKA